MLTENLQRPRWLRTLERLKGRFAPHGTYGIMQVESDRPLSDRESVLVAVRDHFAGTAVAGHEDMWQRLNRLEPCLKRYNSNPDFVELATSALRVGAML
jgi:hypothetical protein